MRIDLELKRKKALSTENGLTQDELRNLREELQREWNA